MRNPCLDDPENPPSARLSSRYISDWLGHLFRPAATATPQLRANRIGAGRTDNICETLLSTDFRLDHHIRVIEWDYIRAAMDLTQGNLSLSAKLLNVNRSTLYSRIQRLEEIFG